MRDWIWCCCKPTSFGSIIQLLPFHVAQNSEHCRKKRNSWILRGNLIGKYISMRYVLYLLSNSALCASRVWFTRQRDLWNVNWSLRWLWMFNNNEDIVEFKCIGNFTRFQNYQQWSRKINNSLPFRCLTDRGEWSRSPNLVFLHTVFVSSFLRLNFKFFYSLSVMPVSLHCTHHCSGLCCFYYRLLGLFPCGKKSKFFFHVMNMFWGYEWVICSQIYS